MSDTLYHEFGNRWERPGSVAATDFVPMLVTVAGVPVQCFVPLSMLPGGSGGTTGVFDVVTANIVAANTIAGNLNGTGSGTFSGSFTGTLVSNQLAASRTLFVDSSGSDSTGTRGSSGYPFLTLGAARAAAQAGDVAEVRPGAYSTTAPLGKAGVNWYFHPGATLTATGDGDTSVLFGDNGPMTFRVAGHGRLIASGSPAGTGSVVAVFDPASDVRVEAALVSLQTGASLNDVGNYTVYQQAGTLYLAADVIEATHSHQYPVIWWQNGKMYVRASEINHAGTDPADAAVTAIVTATPTGDCFVSADRVSAAGAPALLGSSSQAQAKVWLEARLVEGVGGAVLVGGTAGKYYVTAQKIVDNGGSGAGLAALAVGAGNVWVTAQKLTSDYGSGIDVSGGTVRVTCQEIEDLGHLTQGVKVSGGTLWLFNAAITLVSGNGVVCSGGTVHLINCTIATAGAAKDLVQSGGGIIYVHPGTTGSGAAGALTKTGSPTFLTGGP